MYILSEKSNTGIFFFSFLTKLGKRSKVFNYLFLKVASTCIVLRMVLQMLLELLHILIKNDHISLHLFLLKTQPSKKIFFLAILHNSLAT